ncbi:MAG TPA: NAD(P) transhydrogenase subunit alpha [Bacilli bacterium]|nr:MAG: NAD(P) transhydrogenase subunit alpha [Tenericutes bacterium ADurb.BinA124]HNZ50825.1 NAD(P) transhydrogenase subunit alpha [Bacilli bacterium]HOH18295.1 NAD(P) transhydrogenase subunit alpha [Bacilli bacterium]HPX84660.1 NAD(P) transhydrogenase subunit alpha [Bacilli bacterium]HQC74798.1 NAD(P) transhydrogenase subunit alpha [Bacilli bacterium]
MEWILVAVFLVSTILGYILINNVPSLLHTPLMSGMNALSGITLIGALIATAISLKDAHGVLASILGGIAIIVATINVFGGFGVTDRMLKMFKKKG